MPMSTKCKKNDKKMTVSYNMMIGYDIYNGALFSAAKNDIDDQYLLPRLYIKKIISVSKLVCWKKEVPN
jgi:hypothetical protein